MWYHLRTVGTILAAMRRSVQENRPSGNHKRHPPASCSGESYTQVKHSSRCARAKAALGITPMRAGAFSVPRVPSGTSPPPTSPAAQSQSPARLPPGSANRWNRTESRHGRGRAGEYSEKPTAGYSECCGEDISGTPEKGQRPICRYSNIRTKQSQT